MSLPTPGDVIAGKYAIVRVIGEGGMGIVYEATHVRLQQRVAIKMLLPSMLEHDVIVTRFEREARAAAQLRSRHVARVMDVDVTPAGIPYMVMEFLDGHDLQAEIDRRTRLPYEEVVDYLLQACAAMSEAHHVGIVHRDLKPSNLFLADDGGARVVKVLDFGISKVESEAGSKLTTNEAVMGTAYYMSPEQVRSSSTVDARADIWALGVILYELLSGTPPWTGTPTQVAAQIVTDDPPPFPPDVDVPPALAAIVLRALRRSPNERFPDVRALADALGAFAQPHTAGKLALETAFHGAGSSARMALPRARADESAPTLLHANAVSEIERPRSDGTAPGWSQHDGSATRGRTALLGLLAAFGVGLVLIGAGAVAWKRTRPAEIAATAAAPPSAVVVTASAAPEPPASASAAPSAPPASASATPPELSAAVSAASRPPRVAPAAHPFPVRVPPSSTRAAPPKATANPAPTSNPLTL